MLSDTAEGRGYIDEISKSIVTEVAPEELDMFDELAEDITGIFRHQIFHHLKKIIP